MALESLESRFLIDFLAGFKVLDVTGQTVQRTGFRHHHLVNVLAGCERKESEHGGGSQQSEPPGRRWMLQVWARLQK